MYRTDYRQVFCARDGTSLFQKWFQCTLAWEHICIWSLAGEIHNSVKIADQLTSSLASHAQHSVGCALTTATESNAIWQTFICRSARDISTDHCVGEQRACRLYNSTCMPQVNTETVNCRLIPCIVITHRMPVASCEHLHNSSTSITVSEANITITMVCQMEPQFMSVTNDITPQLYLLRHLYISCDLNPITWPHSFMWWV